MKSASSRVKFFTERLQDMQSRASAGEAGRGFDFFKDAYTAYAEEARRDLVLEQRQAAGELLDLRFIGPQAQNGEMPLRHFLDILDPLDKGLSFAAYRLRYGRDARQVDDSTRSTLGLKMAGMASGSARVLVLGDGRPDMTGINLLSATLTQTFRLLNAPAEEFFDAVDAVGGPAARHVGDSLQQAERHGLAAEFTCQRDDAPSLSWQGTPDEIRRVRTLIDTTKDPEILQQELSGPVASLADNGTIYLRNGDERIKVRFPATLLPDVQRLTLGQHATLRVRTARYWDAVLKRDVFKHTLLPKS